MKEIIVIRTSDPDGSIFRSILGALQGKDVQILHAADLDPSALTLGDIEIFPEQRRVTKAGVEVCLNYGEFSCEASWSLTPSTPHTSRPFSEWDIKLRNSIPKASDAESASVSGAIFCHYKKPKCDEKKGDFTFLDEVLMISPR